MSHRLELICAPVGTGKTHHCIQVFRQAIFRERKNFEKSSFFILPNREHADRINDILLRQQPGEKKPPRGILNPSILTINDFIKRFVGVTAEKTPGDILKNFFIRTVLSEGSKLNYFQGQSENQGVVSLLGDFVSETKAAFLTTSEFEERAKPVFEKHYVLAKKLRDLAFLLRNYETKLSASGLKDPADLIRALVDLVNKKDRPPPLQLVILDGFYHFTRAQLEFVKTISRFTKHVIVTLTLDPRASRRHVFEYPERTRQALLQFGFEKIPWEDKENLRATKPALKALEKNLFLPKPAVFAQPQNAVQIFEATAVSGEVEMIAREIRKLYREEDYHYSDFCILLRSIGSYEGPIRSIFEAFNIPVTIHERKRLKQNSFIRAFMKWIRLIEEDWKREDLIRLLKSRYYGFPEEVVMGIEAASHEEGVLEGKDGWSRFAAGRSEAERKILEDLLLVHAKLLSETTPTSFKKILLDFINRHQMIRRLADESEATREDFQAFRTLEKIMDEISLHHYFQGGRPVELAEYLAYLAEAIDISLFSMPSLDKNRVQVYDIAFALQKEYKVVFLAGLLEGNFPKRIAEDPILKDDERKILNDRDPCFELRLDRISGERYFFYMALGRPREKLYLTYPRFDFEGKESLPSFYVEEVKKCFAPDRLPIRKKQVGDVIPLVEEISEREDFYKILTSELFERRNEISPQTTSLCVALFNECSKDEDYSSCLSLILKDEEKAKIEDPKILEWFAKQTGPFSPTRLELFATCPFKYFAARVLNLQEEREALDPVFLGGILHKVLEEFYAENVVSKKEDWIVLKDKDKAQKILLEKLDQVLARSEFSFHGSKKFREDLEKISLAETLKEFLEEEYEIENERRTIPRHFELPFDALEIETDLVVRGRIDRVDHDPESGLAVVVDYKRGSSKLDRMMDNLENGTELQIPIYLLAVIELLCY